MGLVIFQGHSGAREHTRTVSRGAVQYFESSEFQHAEFDRSGAAAGVDDSAGKPRGGTSAIDVDDFAAGSIRTEAAVVTRKQNKQ